MNENIKGSGREMLCAVDLMAMGFSRAIAYQLFHREDFPTVRIGKRLFVRRDRLLKWLEDQENESAAAS